MWYFIKRWLKLLYFKLKYLGKRVTFSKGCCIGIRSRFDGLNVIGDKTSFNGFMGFGTYVGANSNLDGRVGNYCSIADGVSVAVGTHPLEKFVSTHPVFYSLIKQNGDTYITSQRFEETLYADKEAKHIIVIGNDVWIGHGVTLVGGIRIGDGAVILANATVTKDVPAYSIVGGIPARIIKRRFDDDTINFLIRFRWWDKPENWIRQNVEYFADINKFKRQFWEIE